MAKTPLLLVPGLLCSPRLFAGQLAGLSAEADIVVPDWREAPLSVWDTWDSAARWVLAQMPAQRFALAGLSLGGMLSVESGSPTRAISSWCWACRCRASSRPIACPTRCWSTR